MERRGRMRKKRVREGMRAGYSDIIHKKSICYYPEYAGRSETAI